MFPSVLANETVRGEGPPTPAKNNRNIMLFVAPSRYQKGEL